MVAHPESILSAPSYALDRDFAGRVVAWTLQLECSGEKYSGFRFSESADRPTLISTALAILILELFGELHQAQKDEWRETLLRFQDPESSLFIDPLLSPEDLRPGTRSLEYIQHQTTYFVLNALDALQVDPAYPLLFVEPYQNPSNMRSWLEQLDWNQPWAASNWVMFIGHAILFQERQALPGSYRSAIHSMLDWLDEQQNPETGFWGSGESMPPEHAMAAAYHFLPFYLYSGRKLHYVEQMIDHTLSLQEVDGLFHPSGGGDACLDVDALDLLVKCAAQTDYRSADVAQAIDRIFLSMQTNLDDAGGFCRARQRPQPEKSLKRKLVELFGVDILLRKPFHGEKEIWAYGGWTFMPFDIRRGDLWSTWFRSYGLGLISRAYPQKYPSDIPWQFRRLPALGWHGR